MKMLNHTNTSVLTATTTETLLSLPQQLKQQFQLSETLAQQINTHRQTIENILNGTDPRLMVITMFNS